MLNKENLPLWLAVIVAIGFIGVVMTIAFHEVPQTSHDLVMTMVGVLGGAFTTVVGYYYGSSAGSQRKTDNLMTLADKKNGNT